jgi:hypothetical protein
VAITAAEGYQVRVHDDCLRVLFAAVLALAKLGCTKEEAPAHENSVAVVPADKASSSTETVAPTPPPSESVPNVRFVVPHLGRCGAAPAPTDLVDDFEDGDGILPKIGSRNGSWYIATDGTVGAVVRPPLGSANPEHLVPPRCQSNFAFHFNGRGFTTWGAVLGLNFRFDQEVLPVDLSAYRGIRFWARAGEQNGCALRVAIDDASTHPSGGRCSKIVGHERPCWNSFGVDISALSRDWSELFIPFSDLTQKGTEPAPTPLDLTHTYQLTFKMSPANPFDVWIDDVALFP